jgi:ABC-type glycerol-3-phosphate transport system substrate-binding protein
MHQLQFILSEALKQTTLKRSPCSENEVHVKPSGRHAKLTISHRIFQLLGLIRFSAALVCACMLLTACSDSSSQTSGTGNSGKNGEQTKVIEFWTLALSPFFDDYMKGQIAAFEASHPGVKVQWVDVAYDALERKLIASAAAGRAPDVVNMPDLNFARFVSLGAFRDIGGDLPADPETTYLAGALNLCEIRGELLGLPWYVNPQTKIVNTVLLNEGGISIENLPAEWGGLVSRAKAFHEKTGNYLFSQPLGEESQLPIMMLAEGVVPLRMQGDANDPGARLVSNITSPEVTEYLSKWVTLYRSGAMPREAATKGHAHLLDLYQDGKVAVISTGPNFLKRIKDVSVKAYAQTSVREGAMGALGRVHMPVMVLAVTKQSKHPREAALLAWFMTSGPAQTEFCKQAPIMPSALASLDDPFFQVQDPAGSAETPASAGGGATGQAKTSGKEDATLALGRAVAAATLKDAVAFTASLDTWPDLRRAFEDEFKRVLVDGVPLAEALKRIDESWNSILGAAPAASIDSVPRPVRVPVRKFGSGVKASVDSEK